MNEGREGYKKTKIGWIPEDWNLSKLDDLVDFKNGYAFNSNNYSDDGKIIIRMSNISIDGKLNVNEKNIKYTTERNFNELSGFHLKKGDLIMSMTDVSPDFGIVGKTAVIDDDDKYILNQRVGRIRTKINLNTRFLNYYTNSRYYLNPIHKKVTGSAQFNLSTYDIKDSVIPLPPLKEQKKIASILYAVDEKIESINKRIEGTDKLKKGLLQELLTKGIGHTEFKDTKIGRIPRSWEIKTTIETLYMKGRIGWKGLKKDEFTKEGPYLITGVHFVGNRIDWKNCFHITEERYIESPEIMVRNEDILLTKDGTIGKVAYIENLEGKASLNSHLLLLRPEIKNLLPKYLYYIFISSFFKKFINSVKTGSTLVGLSQTNFGKFEYLLPPFQEQQKIASILSTVDKELEVLQEKKGLFYTLKKGLMQQLLTGQMRVKL
jgi:type I restriction enzyme, S subunit